MAYGGKGVSNSRYWSFTSPVALGLYSPPKTLIDASTSLECRLDVLVLSVLSGAFAEAGGLGAFSLPDMAAEIPVWVLCFQARVDWSIEYSCS